MWLVLQPILMIGVGGGRHGRIGSLAHAPVVF
jgi:hypothetical protein